MGARRCDILLWREVAETRGAEAEVASVGGKASVRSREAEMVGLVNAHA